jgi:hypothetical protein
MAKAGVRYNRIPDPAHVLSARGGHGQGGRNERQIITGRDALLKMSIRVLLFFFSSCRNGGTQCKNQIKGSFIHSFIHSFINKEVYIKNSNSKKAAGTELDSGPRSGNFFPYPIQALDRILLSNQKNIKFNLKTLTLVLNLIKT